MSILAARATCWTASPWDTSVSSRSRPSGTPPDRKSTRLNSSHSQISYAVFCLKKKKNINQPTVVYYDIQLSNLIIYNTNAILHVHKSTLRVPVHLTPFKVMQHVYIVLLL